MDQHQGARAIVVGIDGSKAAVTAAEWAFDEVISRTAPLRLVYVIGADDEDYPPETDFAEEALRVATAALHVGGKSVKVDIRRASPLRGGGDPGHRGLPRRDRLKRAIRGFPAAWHVRVISAALQNPCCTTCLTYSR